MGALVFHIFSLYSPHLILLVVDPTPGSSRQYSEENDGKKPHESGERKGMISLDASVSLTESESGAEYEDSSAAYWELYVSEAMINDDNLMEALGGDAETMSIVVRPTASPI